MALQLPLCTFALPYSPPFSWLTLAISPLSPLSSLPHLLHLLRSLLPSLLLLRPPPSQPSLRCSQSQSQSPRAYLRATQILSCRSLSQPSAGWETTTRRGEWSGREVERMERARRSPKAAISRFCCKRALFDSRGLSSLTRIANPPPLTLPHQRFFFDNSLVFCAVEKSRLKTVEKSVDPLSCRYGACRYRIQVLRPDLTPSPSPHPQTSLSFKASSKSRLGSGSQILVSALRLPSLTSASSSTVPCS